MQIPTQPMLPSTEVSEVSGVTPIPVSQEVTPPQGESFKTIKPNGSNPWTDHFKEAPRSNRSLLFPSTPPSYVLINPCKYIVKQLNSSES